MVNNPRAHESNHVIALSQIENGNNLSLMASSVTPFILKVSYICESLDKCECGTSVAAPPS